MRQRLIKCLGVAAFAVVLVTSWQVWSVAQQPGGEKGKDAAAASRLEFEVVQSFDAKYEGDTPGHMGRAGGLSNRRLHIALGDSVFRGDQTVGMVTGLTWNRTNGSLDIEFDPAENTRICVGDAVWLVLDNPSSSKPAESKTK